jgi:hypothetical protein
VVRIHTEIDAHGERDYSHTVYDEYAADWVGIYIILRSMHESEYLALEGRLGGLASDAAAAAADDEFEGVLVRLAAQEEVEAPEDLLLGPGVCGRLLLRQRKRRRVVQAQTVEQAKVHEAE